MGKWIFFVLGGFHLLWLSIGILFGEGILFGFRVFEEIQFFNIIQIFVTGLSIFLVIRNSNKGYIMFAVSLISTYLIQFGHHMYWWPCEYCRLGF